MATAGASTFRRAPSARTRARPADPRAAVANVRWDRVGRVTLLIVVAFVLLLYIGPARSYVQTWRQSNARHAELSRLEAEHAHLLARRHALGDPRSLERDARALGMIKPGERAFVVQGLPGD